MNYESEKFWKVHEKNRALGFFSDSFKHLVTSMLKYDPAMRPNLANIVGHPWMQGEMPTRDEIKTEFLRRSGSLQ